MADEKPTIDDLPNTDFLNDQQREFVREYLRTGNASQAAEHAKYKWPGQTGWHLLKNPKIRDAVDTALKSKQIGEVQVLAELSELAYITLADFIDEEGNVNVRKVHDKGHLVKKYKCKRNKKLSTYEVWVDDIEIELHDRHAALVDVGKKYRMFGDDTLNLTILQVVVNTLDAELPKEQAGRVLGRIADGLRTGRS